MKRNLALLFAFSFAVFVAAWMLPACSNPPPARAPCTGDSPGRVACTTSLEICRIQGGTARGAPSCTVLSDGGERWTCPRCNASDGGTATTLRGHYEACEGDEQCPPDDTCTDFGLPFGRTCSPTCRVHGDCPRPPTSAIETCDSDGRGCYLLCTAMKTCPYGQRCALRDASVAGSCSTR